MLFFNIHKRNNVRKYEREHEVETEDMGEEEESDPGVYRSYEDYLMSGGPIDPCDDALWLHDQE